MGPRGVWTVQRRRGGVGVSEPSVEVGGWRGEMDVAGVRVCRESVKSGEEVSASL